MSLGSATLNLSLVDGFTPSHGDVFTVINNETADPVNGIFAGLPEGATFDAAGAVWQISYVGGAGQEVTLTDQFPVPCYCRGTRILTTAGEVEVERLQVGDKAVTASGALRPIAWIGHRRLDIEHRAPEKVRPICVRAGAFGEGLPRRDLWLSPGHHIRWKDVLIPASALVNGQSVVGAAPDRVEYWHVELDAHDILIAEGLPAESYLDCGNWGGFANGGAFIEAHPDFTPKHFRETLSSDGLARTRFRCCETATDRAVAGAGRRDQR